MTLEPNIPISANVEISIAAIDERGKYKKLPHDVGLKTTKLVEELKKLKVFENQEFGTTIEITENKIYLKTEAGLVEALTLEEAQEKFPEVQKVMDSMARTLQKDIKVDPKTKTPVKGGMASAVSREKKLSNKSRLIVEIKILKGPITNIADIAHEVQTQKPDLAAQIIEKAQELDKLEKKASKAEEEEGYIEESELSGKILDARREIYVLLEAAKTAIYAEKVIKGILPFSFEYRGEGKAKEIHNIVALPKVAIIPRGGALEAITGSREKEIIGEVNTSERIKRALYEPKFIELFEKIGIEDPEAETEKLLKTFTRSELIRIFETRDHNALWVVADIDKLEAAAMFRNRKDILEILQLGENIAFEYKLLGRLIEGKLTYEAPAAESDLEEFIRRGDVDFPTKMSIIAQIAAGMRDLHASGHAHGDLKAENILMYKKTLPDGKVVYIVRIADFGKTRQVKPGEDLFYSGNARHEAPEKRLSFESEDFGAAMIIMRVLEDDLLNPTTEMMIEPSRGLKWVAPHGVRRGIEKYVTESALTYQREATGFGKVLAFSPRAAPKLLQTAEALKLAENEMHRYVAMLIQKLADQSPDVDREQLAGLESLLKDMTLSDPAKRPTMDEVYNRILQTGLVEVNWH